MYRKPTTVPPANTNSRHSVSPGFMNLLFGSRKIYVACPDESLFEMFRADGRVPAWRRHYKIMDPIFNKASSILWEVP